MLWHTGRNGAQGLVGCGGVGRMSGRSAGTWNLHAAVEFGARWWSVVLLYVHDAELRAFGSNAWITISGLGDVAGLRASFVSSDSWFYFSISF